MYTHLLTYHVPNHAQHTLTHTQRRKDAMLCDTSDDGYFMNFRNETLNGEPFIWNGVFVVPAAGILEFDYVSTGRPSFDAMPITAGALEVVVKEVAAQQTDMDKLVVLRHYSCDYYFTTSQVCACICMYVCTYVHMFASAGLDMVFVHPNCMRAYTCICTGNQCMRTSMLLQIVTHT